MRYDIRINNIFYREVEGYDFENALNNAGMDVDFIERGNGGEVLFDNADIVGLIDENTSDEIKEEVASGRELKMTFGVAE